MSNYSLPKYDECRQWIRKAREHKIEWDAVKFANQGDEEGLHKFIEKQKVDQWWEVTADEWYDLVTLEKEAEEEILNLREMEGQAMIQEDDHSNGVTIPYAKGSSWVLYKNHLLLK